MGEFGEVVWRGDDDPGLGEVFERGGLLEEVLAMLFGGDDGGDAALRGAADGLPGERGGVGGEVADEVVALPGACGEDAVADGGEGGCEAADGAREPLVGGLVGWGEGEDFGWCGGAAVGLEGGELEFAALSDGLGEGFLVADGAGLVEDVALEGGRDGVGYRGLVSVEFRLVGAFHRHSEIVGLLLAQGSQPGVEGVKVESGHLLV